MRHYRDAALGLGGEALNTALGHALQMVANTCIWIIASMLVLVLFDVPYQLWQLRQEAAHDQAKRSSASSRKARATRSSRARSASSSVKWRDAG